MFEVNNTGVFVVNFEYSVFIVNFKYLLAGWAGATNF